MYYFTGKPVTNCPERKKVPCCHIWTNKGDSLFLESNSLITPSGPLTIKHIKKLFNSGEKIIIEMPRFKDVSKILTHNGNMIYESLISVFALNAIPINFEGDPVIKIPTQNLYSILNLVERFGIKCAKKAEGEKWSWIVLNRGSCQKNEKIINKHTHPFLSKETIKLAHLLTNFDIDDVELNVTSPEQAILRLMVILYYFYNNIPFQISTHPVSCPLEIRISQIDSWEPYARVINIFDANSRIMGLQFESDQFIPLVSNFMVLS